MLIDEELLVILESYREYRFHQLSDNALLVSRTKFDSMRYKMMIELARAEASSLPTDLALVKDLERAISSLNAICHGIGIVSSNRLESDADWLSLIEDVEL